MITDTVLTRAKKKRPGYPCVKCSKIGYFSTGECSSCRTRDCTQCGKKYLPQENQTACFKCRAKIRNRQRTRASQYE